jgi:SAM-dependent methyltransferase
MNGSPKLYTYLARWFPLLTPPAHYQKEAAIYRELFLRHDPAARTILELGSGGGHNAFYLKKHYSMTLVDLSPEMIVQSKKLNPGCEHIPGDMRDIRLGRTFDAVFIHDAISYMTTPGDLQKAIITAAEHCRDGGCLLFVPDFFTETFITSTYHGGTDGEREGMRYLEWIHEPAPGRRTYTMDFALLLKDEQGKVTVEHDQHELGLFSKTEWFDMLQEAGLEARIETIPLNDEECSELQIVYAFSVTEGRGCCHSPDTFRQ